MHEASRSRLLEFAIAYRTPPRSSTTGAARPHYNGSTSTYVSSTAVAGLCCRAAVAILVLAQSPLASTRIRTSSKKPRRPVSEVPKFHLSIRLLILSVSNVLANRVASRLAPALGAEEDDSRRGSWSGYPCGRTTGGETAMSDISIGEGTLRMHGASPDGRKGAGRCPAL